MRTNRVIFARERAVIIKTKFILDSMAEMAFLMYRRMTN